MNYIKINGEIIDAQLIDTIEISDDPNSETIKVDIITVDRLGYSEVIGKGAQHFHWIVRSLCQRAKDEIHKLREEHGYDIQQRHLSRLLEEIQPQGLSEKHF